MKKLSQRLNRLEQRTAPPAVPRVFVCYEGGPWYVGGVLSTRKPADHEMQIVIEYVAAGEEKAG